MAQRTTPEATATGDAVTGSEATGQQAREVVTRAQGQPTEGTSLPPATTEGENHFNASAEPITTAQTGQTEDMHKQEEQRAYEARLREQNPTMVVYREAAEGVGGANFEYGRMVKQQEGDEKTE